jgi:hypothetical protein
MSNVWLFGDYNQAESRVVAWKGPVPKLKQWYSDGVDVHSYVCRLIAKVIQENNIQTPGMLFRGKSHDTYGKGDEERELAKRTVHAYNYGMGVGKFSIITGLSEQFATILLKVYGTLFPEIKSGYHAWVEQSIRKDRTIWMPEPVRFRKIFYDIVNDELMRSAFSCYPQCTVAGLLNRTIAICATIFLHDHNEEFREQWYTWYGKENWERWRVLRGKGVKTPQAILWGGMDIRLNVHDAGGLALPNDPDLIKWASKTWKAVAETPIQVRENETMIIPVDFKIGATWGSDDLKDYK